MHGKRGSRLLGAIVAIAAMYMIEGSASAQGFTIFDCDVSIEPGVGEPGERFRVEYIKDTTVTPPALEITIESTQAVTIEQSAQSRRSMAANVRYDLRLEGFSGSATDDITASMVNSMNALDVIYTSGTVMDWFGEAATSGEPYITFTEDSPTSLTMHVQYRKRIITFSFAINGGGSLETASLGLVRLSPGGGAVGLEYFVEGPKDDQLLINITATVGIYLGQPSLVNKRVYLPVTTTGDHKLLIDGYTAMGTLTCQLLKEDGFFAIPAGTQPATTGVWDNADTIPRIRLMPHRSNDPTLAMLYIRYKGRQVVFEVKFS